MDCLAVSKQWIFKVSCLLLQVSSLFVSFWLSWRKVSLVTALGMTVALAVCVGPIGSGQDARCPFGEAFAGTDHCHLVVPDYLYDQLLTSPAALEFCKHLVVKSLRVNPLTILCRPPSRRICHLLCVRWTKKSSMNVVVFMLLILSGDVELNPAQVQLGLAQLGVMSMTLLPKNPWSLTVVMPG